jgi:hypothetical protein
MMRRAILLRRRISIKTRYGKEINNGFGSGTRCPVGNLSELMIIGKALSLEISPVALSAVRTRILGLEKLLSSSGSVQAQ